MSFVCTWCSMKHLIIYQQIVDCIKSRHLKPFCLNATPFFFSSSAEISLKLAAGNFPDTTGTSRI